MEDDLKDGQFGELHNIADEVEEVVLQDNIYKRPVFEKLVDLEKCINKTRSQTGMEVRDILNASGAREPLDILNSAIRYWDEKLKSQQLGSEEELIQLLEKDFKIKVKRAQIIGIPPDTVSPGIEGNDEEKDEKKNADFNRVALALHTLLHMKVDGEPILLDDMDAPTISDIPDSSFRKRPYWSLNVKKYKIAVFVNNQYKNSTFVVGYKTKKDYEKLFGSTKSELKSHPEIRHFRFDDPEQFAADLTEAFESIRQNQIMNPMDAMYFSDQAKVRVDLENFALKIGKPIEETSVGNIPSVEITCANGERVKGQKYLKRAAFNLGLAVSIEKGASFQGQALKLLKEKIGIKSIFVPMDAEYFSSREKIAKDLEAIALANKRSVDKLSTSTDIIRREYTFSTGEKLHGYTYLSRAAISLKMAEESIKAGHVHGATLRRLKEIAGYKIETFPEMDADYFKNKEKIQKDLKAYADKLAKKIEELNTENISATEVVCSNGESLKGQTYLRRATLAFGLTEDPDEVGSFQKETLNKLKETTGIFIAKKMDAEYFSDNQKLRADMENLSGLVQRPIADFTVNVMGGHKILCTNGETISTDTYLDRFAVALGIAKNSREANKIRVKVLEIIKERLKEKEIEIYDLMV